MDDAACDLRMNRFVDMRRRDVLSNVQRNHSYSSLVSLTLLQGVDGCTVMVVE